MQKLLPSGAATGWRAAQAAAAMCWLWTTVELAAWLAHRTTGSPSEFARQTAGPLICALAWIVLRYSERCLEGQPRQSRYLAAMSGALCAVLAVVQTDNLALLALAWSISSLFVHSLLCFYPEREGARTGARQKFIVSRMAEVLLVAALTLIYIECGSFSLAAIAQSLAAPDGLSPSLQAAALLIALAAILKSAQLPFHGWLLQVMEAPTPVSALLHAGIVNLGGFVLIRLAPLMDAAPAARSLLVIWGGACALLAGLVSATRPSVKSRLAWSTCAQMGFMLLECGLGLYALALLHLVGHSLYKAHAFLSAGDGVRTMPTAMPEQRGWRMLAQRVWAAPVAVAIMATSAAAWTGMPGATPVPWVALLIAGLGLAPLLMLPGWSGRLQMVLLGQVYCGWHLLFGWATAETLTPPLPLAVGAAACLLGLYLLTAWVDAFASGRLAQTLRHRTFRARPARAARASDHPARPPFRALPSLHAGETA